MEKLFINKPEFEKNASGRKYLGADSNTWVKEIIVNFLESYPMLQNEPLTVTWEKTKFDKGYATGKLNIPSASVTVPIIVKDFIMAPLDVVNRAGVFLPLNEFTIKELLTSKTPFNRMTSSAPEVDLTLFGEGTELQFSPTGSSSPSSMGDASSKTRDAVKVGSFIDHITNVDRNDVASLLTPLKDRTILASFELNDNIDVLEKLSTISLASVTDEYEALVRDLNLDISYVYEDENGNTFLKQANSRIDYVWEIPITSSELDDLKIKAVEDKRESFKFASYEEQEVVKSDPTIGDCGYFKLGESKTPQVCIVNISKTPETSEKYATYKLDKGYIALNDNNDYFINDRNNIKIAQAIEVAGTDPNIGDYGVWVVNDKATEPFVVESIYKSATHGEYEIVGNRGISKVAYYPIVSNRDDLVVKEDKVNTDFKAAYYVPGNAKFIKLNNDLSKSAELTDAYLSEKLASIENNYGLLKIAGFNTLSGKYQFHVVEDANEIVKKAEYEYDIPVTADFVTVERAVVEESKSIVKHACGRDNAGLYYLEGPEFKKYAQAHEVRNLSKDVAVWSLLHCKGSEEDIKKLAELKYGEQFVVNANLEAPVSVKDLANTLEHAIESFDNATPLKKNLIKQAAVLQDKSTVDAILSLGLINKRNLMEYVSMLPNYEVVLSELAELLLMTRMGLAGVDEYAVTDALEALSQVVKGLKEVQSVTSLK